jgi:hypothetical protein
MYAGVRRHLPIWGLEKTWRLVVVALCRAPVY